MGCVQSARNYCVVYQLHPCFIVVFSCISCISSSVFQVSSSVFPADCAVLQLHRWLIVVSVLRSGRLKPLLGSENANSANFDSLPSNRSWPCQVRVKLKYGFRFRFCSRLHHIPSFLYSDAKLSWWLLSTLKYLHCHLDKADDENATKVHILLSVVMTPVQSPGLSSQFSRLTVKRVATM